ncbi:MAG: HEAT repeat domain-containing protein, partial [Bacteroidales bacterium]|nr:HEAT repeat domain-containing protein [Bacteroidales bacterium]
MKNRPLPALILFLLVCLLNGPSIAIIAQDTIPAVDSTIYATATMEDVQQSIRAYSNAKLQRLYTIFGKSPRLIIFLYVIIIYSIIAMTILTVFILFNRRKIQDEIELKERLSILYQQLLIDYMFEEEKQKEIFKNLRRIASSKFKRQVLINQIIELSVNMQGESKADLKEIYIELGLKSDSLKKAYSKKWHENVKGFRELAFMNIRSANDHIIKCLNSKNEILRMEAQISLVRLSDDNPYLFLDYLEKPLSLWEQISLHELLVQHEMNVPDFSQWFESKNLSIVIFSLEMTSWFKQIESVEGVIMLMSHENERVRKSAVETSGALGMKAVLPHLEKMYREESFFIRYEILKAFGKVSD